MSVLEADENLRRGLEHVAERLEDQFGGVDGRLVQAHVHVVAKRLLDRARFPDFVPLLTERYARERLESIVAAPPG